MAESVSVLLVSIAAADLKDVRLRHCKVLSWSDNRFGGLPHWRIEGE